MLVVRVMEPADAGRATEAALRAVSGAVGVPRRSVTLVRGAAGRRKLVEIDVAPDDVARLARAVWIMRRAFLVAEQGVDAVAGGTSIENATGVGSIDLAALASETEEEQRMLFITEYTLKPHMSKSEVKELMDEFGKRGAGPGEIANYVKVDGSGGYTIADDDDMSAAYETALAYSQYMTFTVSPILKIDDAVGPIFAYLG